MPASASLLDVHEPTLRGVCLCPFDRDHSPAFVVCGVAQRSNRFGQRRVAGRDVCPHSKRY
jgi:hypothetical protein